MKAQQSIAGKLQRSLIIGSAILITLLGVALYVVPKYVFHKNLSLTADSIKASLYEAINLYGKIHLSEALATAEDPQVKAIYLGLKREVGDLTNLNEKTRPIFEKYGRELRNHVEPWLKRIEKDTGIRPRLHFHLPNARSFVRTWRKPAPGEDVRLDDLSGFRATIVTAQRERKIVLGLEPGREGVVFRAVVPIIVENELLGSVESGDHLSAFVEHFIKSQPEADQFFIMLDRNLEKVVEFYIKEGKAKVTEKGILYAKSEKLTEDEILKISNIAEKKDLFIRSSIGYVKVPIKAYNGDNLGYIVVGFNIKSQVLLFRTAFGFLILTLVLFMSAFTFALTRRMKGCVAELVTTTSAMEKLAQGGGDLTFRLPVKSQDEIGKLANSFNMFMESLGDIVRNLISRVSDLFRSSDTLARETEILEQMTYDFKEKADFIALSSTEILSSMEEVSRSLQELSNAIAEIAERAQESANVVKRTVVTVDSTKEKVEFLNKASAEIDEVVNLINSIAEQTNLLALNASIEAARAGEAGKGFAVVANEVKELARQTQEATRNIAEKIRLLQTSSHEVASGVDEVVQLIKTVEDASASIASAVEEQTIVVNSVSEHVLGVKDKVMINEEQANAIKRSSDELGNLSQKLREIGEEIKKVALEIKGITDQFKV